MELNSLPSPEILLHHSRKGPRYTSYPTAPMWREDFSQDQFDASLQRLQSPAEIYVHIPFCVAQCTFCACNMVVAGRREPGVRYLDNLERQVEQLRLPADRVEVARIHLGGGTPTWLSPTELERLYSILYSRFRPIAGAEISVEADPEVTTDEQVDVLAGLGVNRLSMGVQSFDPVVLEAINRPQEHTRVHAIMDRARGLGMSSMNLDLVYGLPHQTPKRFTDTLTKTLAMRPDRLAVFGYAHVPWLKWHQKFIRAEDLPKPLERVELFLLAHRMLSDVGYQAIGMDHFALPDDELSQAQRAERLHRNFMGYTTRPDLEMIGLGMSAISELGDCYVQQRTRLSEWWQSMEGEGSPIEKGLRLSAEDLLRREVINRIMCNFVLPTEEVEARHGVRFDVHFAKELTALEPMEAQGLVQRDAGVIRVTGAGRLLVRNIAMVFDEYLDQPSDSPRYSQTV